MDVKVLRWSAGDPCIRKQLLIARPRAFSTACRVDWEGRVLGHSRPVLSFPKPPDLPVLDAVRQPDRNSRGALGAYAAEMPIRVVIADDSYLMREAVAGLLEEASDLALVGTASSLPELLEVVAREQPDAVVTDVRMPPSGTDEGIAAATMLRGDAPTVGVVVLSQHLLSEYAVRLFEGGTAGRAYLLKDRIAGGEELAEAVRAVAVGDSVIDPLVVEALVTERSRRPSPLDRLTPRERDVLAEMATGRNNAAIAESLVLTERAVAKHINAIFSKLELAEEDSVHRRVRAVLLFMSQQ